MASRSAVAVRNERDRSGGSLATIARPDSEELLKGKNCLPVVDLFSGTGGMSCGFQAHPRFEVVGAVDAEIGKPSTGSGAIDCNGTYEANIGIKPTFADLGVIDPEELKSILVPALEGRELAVLSACPPCTGFSRVNANNHLKDDPRNSLVARTARFVEALRPHIFVMENARELLIGRFKQHFRTLADHLRDLGYEVSSEVHMLTRFGLPQFRERAMVIAARSPLVLRSLADLWDGYSVRPEATTVRHAIAAMPVVAAGETHSQDSAHTSTDLSRSINIERLREIPSDGGSWADLIEHRDAERLLSTTVAEDLFSAESRPRFDGSTVCSEHVEANFPSFFGTEQTFCNCSIRNYLETALD